MLNSNSLFGDEYKALFETFGDMELAIFAKVVFYEELRDDFLDFKTIMFSRNESDAEWKMYYIEFMQSLSKDRIRSIESYISDIDYEETKFWG